MTRYSSKAGRPRLPYLRTDWKLSLSAAIAAEIDLLLEHPLTHKPHYGSRSRLIEALLRNYINAMQGLPEAQVPTLEELRRGN